MIFPRSDILDLCKISDATFWPMQRQEISRSAGARTQAKDLGSPLWRASFTTAPARLADAAAIEAALISLRGSAGSFLAHDVRRPFPLEHPGGYPGAVSISLLYSDDAFSVRLTAPDGGFYIRPGDYIGFQYGAASSYALHLVTVGGNIAPPGGNRKIEVFPAIRPGAQVGAAVTVNRAPCQMILEPGQQPPSLRQMVASAVSFSAIQIL